jgi:hypothetical protein
MNLKRLGAAALVGCSLLLGCSPPKYVLYWSIWRDWRSAVPWGWNIRTDEEAPDFASTNLIGPFAPEFYLGAPSFGVRWYRNNSKHTLPDGLVEYYRDADDYIERTLEDIYPGGEVVTVPKEADKAPVISGMDEVYLAGRKAKHFVVAHTIAAPDNVRYGVGTDKRTKNRFIERLHEYVVLQLDAGFYVLVYPATSMGYHLFRKEFHNFVGKFHIATDGPKGAPLGASAETPAAAAGR